MNYETPTSPERRERHEDHVETGTYGFREIFRLVEDLGETPEELKRAIADPDLFFERLEGMKHPDDRDGSDGEETYRKALGRLEEALRRSPVAGEGTSNRFRILDDASADGIPEALVDKIGIREMKREPITDPGTGSRYLGIPVNPDQPDPVHSFRNGVMVQAIGSAMKGAFPEILRYTERKGAVDMNTGRPIPGLEQETVGMSAIMEVLNGPSLAQIVDREGLFWQRRYSARSPESLTDFLKDPGNERYVRDSIEEATKRWPGLRSIDWNGLPDLFEKKVKFINGLVGGVGILHKDLHFGNSTVVFADKAGRYPDPRLIGFLDFDLSTLSTDPEFGQRPEDYINGPKSTSLREQFHMPDLMPEDSGKMRGMGSIIRLDAATHHRALFEIIGKTIGNGER